MPERSAFAAINSPKILKFGTNIGYDLLYCVGQNQHPHAYYSLYLSIFFSPTKFFIKDFSGITAPRILKFCINIGYVFLYRVRENQHPHAYHSFFLSPIEYFITDFSAPKRARVFKFCIRLQRI